MEIVIVLAAVLLGLIPAFIASGKGHNFILWWLFGAALFIIALPVAILIQPHQAQRVSELDIIDGLEKLNRLRSEGVINDEEFERMKGQALATPYAARQASTYDPSVPADPLPTRIILYGLGVVVVVLILAALIV